MRRRWVGAALAVLGAVLVLCRPGVAALATPAPAAAVSRWAATRPSLALPLPGPAGPSATAVPPTPSPIPTQVASSGGPGIYFDDGREIFEVGADGTGLAALAVLPPGADFVPHAAGGRLLYYDGNYWLTTPSGVRQAVAAPALGPGEQVFAAWPEPDGTHIAWQLYSPGTYSGRITNLGASRIVLTDSGGGNARTIMQQGGGSTYGDVAELVGWRAAGLPLAAAAGVQETVLIQTRVAAQGDGTTVRGLQELDPSIGDLVNDFLPPTTTDLPTPLTLSVSDDGRLATFAATQARLPSGEGPLPTSLAVLNLATLRTTVFDTSAAYPGPPAPPRYPWTRYPYFSQRAGAPIAPDDNHVLYTLVSVTYPDGATTPQLDETAELASLVTGRHVLLAAHARAVGWLNASTAIVRKADGLYAVDLTTGHARLIVRGAGLRFLGVRGG